MKKVAPRVPFSCFSLRIAAPATLVLVLLACLASRASAQQLFTTARTEGFGTPSIVLGLSHTTLDADRGLDYTFFTARLSVGIGRKTDIFGSFNGILGQGSDVSTTVDKNFLSWTLGMNHQFLRTPLVDAGGIVRLRSNHTDNQRFEDALLDFVGIVSLQASPFHPYYALMFSRPFGFSFNDSFQKTSVFGVEIPFGDIPRVIGEVSFGDRRSFGVALKLSF